MTRSGWPGPGDDGDASELTRSLPDVVGTRWSDGEQRLSAYARDAYPLAIKASLGEGSPFRPLAIAWPESTSEVAGLVRLAGRLDLPIIPFGGGSGIVGGVLGERPGLVVDLKRMGRIRAIDEVSLTATVEAGILGARLEQRLGMSGLTTGHYPQSLHASTVGGWIAHRGIGTFSTLYGRIDEIVLGLEVVLPDGRVLVTNPAPGSAAGPDLKRLFIGSEGTLGIVTAAVLRLVRRPPVQRGRAFAVPSLRVGLTTVRELVQAGYRPAVVRLYDSLETKAQFGSLGLAENEVVLLLVSEGPDELVAAVERGTDALVRANGLRELGPEVVAHWFEHRYSTAGLIDTLSRPSGVADALEVAHDWANLEDMYERMREAMGRAAGPGAQVYGHVSHVYPSGANLYLIFHADADADADVETRYRAILAAAMASCLDSGGTITHHHGVGLAKSAWLPLELGEAGMAILRAVKGGLDDRGLMNPGRLGLR